MILDIVLRSNLGSPEKSSVGGARTEGIATAHACRIRFGTERDSRRFTVAVRRRRCARRCAGEEGLVLIGVRGRCPEEILICSLWLRRAPSCRQSIPRIAVVLHPGPTSSGSTASLQTLHTRICENAEKLRVSLRQTSFPVCGRLNAGIRCKQQVHVSLCLERYARNFDNAASRWGVGVESLSHGTVKMPGRT